MVYQLGLDTETTGVDLYHGAEPYLVTFCDNEFCNTYFQWDVDPLTRQVQVVKRDLEEILYLIEQADELVFQNPKFDVKGITKITERVLGKTLVWPWEKTKDTLLAGHLLASNHPHTLDAMAIEFLGVNIRKYEAAMKTAVQAIRKLIQKPGSEFSDWFIADEGKPGMPSVEKGGKDTDAPWKNDTWLPRVFVQWCYANERLDYLLELLPEVPLPVDWRKHPWATVTEEYANSDSATTLALYNAQMEMIEERGLEKIYAKRLELLPVVAKTEQIGLTLNRDRLTELTEEYKKGSAQAEKTCLDIAKSYEYDLTLPKSGSNNSLYNFVFETMRLPIVSFTDGGKYSLNKNSIEYWQASLPPRSKQKRFIDSLRGKRQRDTALSYMANYRNYWIPVDVDKNGAGWYVLHPSLNPTGTATLRFSSYNPNEQNISKQEGFNLRYCYGPLPGREWWSLDAKNIELRIPAYESGEPDLIILFEKPDDPPYYGSNHLLNFHTVYPDLWNKALKEVGFEKVGPYCKKFYAASWYQFCKNGGFAIQYGAQQATAEAAFHKEGAFALLKSRFRKLEDLNQKYISHAERYGYVETMPDKEVDPEKGYPLLCTRTEYGGILPTVPLNYHVQGTAMWWMMKAMIRSQAQLDNWNEGLEPSKQYHLICQVHDELLFDFPYKPNKGNLPKLLKIKKLCEMGGHDLGLPTPVGIEYIKDNWSNGETIA